MNNELMNYANNWKEVDGTIVWVSIPKYVSKKQLGKPVGSINGAGYRIFSYKGILYLVHRVYMSNILGYMPNETDHIDGDTLNNRILNLRDVTHLDNMKNRKRHNNNTSGCMGVSKYKNSWVVFIGGKYICSNKDKDIAIAMRKKAEIDLGYHNNHGRAI